MDVWVEESLRAYGMTSAQVAPMAQGCDNENLLVRCEGRRFVLRRYRVTPSAEVAFELEAIAALVRSGFPTAPWLPTADGRSSLEIDGDRAALFAFVEGEVLSDDPEHGPAVARLVARMHEATAGEPLAGERSRTDDGRLQAFASATEADHRLGAKAGAREFAARCRELLEETAASDLDRLPSVLAHRDMHGGNLLVGEDGGIRALLDFDEACAGPAVLDIAALLELWARDDAGWFDPLLVMGVLQAYEEVRPLPAQERALVPLALRRRIAGDAAEYLLRNFAGHQDLELAECHALAFSDALESRQAELASLIG